MGVRTQSENEAVPRRGHSGRHALEKLLMRRIMTHVDEECPGWIQRLSDRNRLIESHVRRVRPVSEHVQNQGFQPTKRLPGLRRDRRDIRAPCQRQWVRLFFERHTCGIDGIDSESEDGKPPMQEAHRSEPETVSEKRLQWLHHAMQEIRQE